MKSYFTVLCILVLFIATTFTTSIAQIPWTKDANNPVMFGGASGTWNRLAMMPNVLYNTDSSRYEMWYAGSPGSPLRPYRIGFATSPDGISWTKHPNPVLTPTAGTWDESTVEVPMVLRENGQYKMWYSGWSPTDEAGIGYATSPDGINWTKHASNPVVQAGTDAWEKGGSGYCTVIPDPGGYKMWYTGFNADYSESSIGYASSSDGISWQKDTQNNPVLTPGTPGQWENPKIMTPQVVFLNSVYHIWYTGGQIPTGTRKIGWATSVDGIQWNKYSDPVLSATSGQWDGTTIETGTVMLDGDSLRMWYSGWVRPAPPNLLSIGHATAPVILNVPDNFETIQAAIDAAHDGNVVLVDEGTYYENINFKGKAITVASHFYMDDDTSHVSKTIIDGSQHANPDSGSVVYFGSGEDTSSVLLGFTITGGSGTYNPQYSVRWGGGIACWFSGARITSNIIISNTLTGNSNWVIGGGFAAGYLGSNAYVILENNQITNNEANSTGDGAYGGGVGLACNGRLVDNIISYNSCTSTANNANGGGVNITAESEILPRTVMITGNRITHNFAEGKGTESPYYWAAKGGGIINQYSKILVLDNEISHNQLSDVGTGNGSGGGIYTYRAGSGSVISRNTISNNLNEVTDTKYGGGISLASNDVPVNNNIISGNSASHGGGIYCTYSDPEIINNTIVDNTASTSGGGLYSTNSNPVVINTILWDNEATSGSQIYGSGYVLYSDIQGGWSGEGNIDADPMFSDTIYHLSEESPCIDAGHDSSFFNDIEDGGIAKWPAMGTLRNDQGAYGGPKEYDITALRNLIDYILNIADEDANVALTYKLNQNYPNPFNPKTMINYQLPKTSEVEIKIYNILGQKVITLVSERQKAGNHQAQWNASGLASGIYYYSLTAGEFRDVKKMILLK